jgi:tetratricopeptide (TPR) repeat protein
MAVMAISFVALPLAKRQRPVMMLLVAIVIPLAAAGLYSVLGSPDSVTAAPHSNVAQAPAMTGMNSQLTSSQSTGSQSTGSQAPPVSSMVDGLAERLRQNPDDAGSWLLLARSYQHLNRNTEALEAYAKAASMGEYDEALANLSTQPAGNGVEIRGAVQLAPEHLDIVRPDDTVFIFAKAVNGPAAPLAVVQRAAAEMPLEFSLNDSQSMIAGLKLSDFEEVVVTARITRGGDATVALQGLEAKSATIEVGQENPLKLIIQ